MNKKILYIWISIVGFIGILFGIFYALFGLSGLPAYNYLIPKNIIGPWSNGLYGATFIGFNVLWFFIGRYAVRNNDKELMKYLLYGLFAWLIVEAAFSIYYKVYFNVAVDIAIALFIGIPLIKCIRVSKIK